MSGQVYTILLHFTTNEAAGEVCVVQQVRPDRVAIYIRWSTDDQGDGTTAQVQLEGCRHYVLSQGWTVAEDLIFVDDGYSGGDLNRPAMANLRAAVAAGRVDCVVVFKIDRLSRNVVDTVNLVLREWEGRAYVKSAREPIDTTTPAGKMFFYTLVSFAEWERSVIRERTLSGKLRRLQEGRNPGFRPPYGLVVGDSPGAFALVPAEADVVREAFALCRAGLRPGEIARQLAARGLQFRADRPFTGRIVSAILRNPIYAGRLVYGRRVANPRRHDGGSRQIKSRTEPTVVSRTAVPPIVDEATFADAQSQLDSLALRDGRSAESSHLLTGLARCRCSRGLVGVSTAAGVYYVCAGKRAEGAGRCGGAHIRADELDGWLTAKFLGRLTEMVPGAGSAVQIRKLWGQVGPQARKRLLRQFVAGLTVYRAPGSRQVEYNLCWVAAPQGAPHPSQVCQSSPTSP